MLWMTGVHLMEIIDPFFESAKISTLYVHSGFFLDWCSQPNVGLSNHAWRTVMRVCFNLDLDSFSRSVKNQTQLNIAMLASLFAVKKLWLFNNPSFSPKQLVAEKHQSSPWTKKDKTKNLCVSCESIYIWKEQQSTMILCKCVVFCIQFCVLERSGSPLCYHTSVSCSVIDASGLFLFASVGRRRTGSVDSFRLLPYSGTLSSYASHNTGKSRSN